MRATLLLVCGVAWGCLLFPSVAQTEEVLEIKEVLETGNPVDSAMPGEPVSLDFKDAEIQSVLQVLARKAKANVVASRNVVGTVTIHLENVSWEQALEAVLKTYGYGYEKEGSIYLVATLDELHARREALKKLVEAEVPLATKILRPRYLKIEEVKAFLESHLSAQGKITLFSQALVVTDTAATVERLERLLDQIDVAPPVAEAPPSAPAAVSPARLLTLQGILFDPGGDSYAAINGRVVQEMEEIEGARVLQIEPMKVTVLVGEEMYVLPLDQESKEEETP